MGSAGFVPTADKGTLPGGGPVGNFARRALRKATDRAEDVVKFMGMERAVQHSWHDYQNYWRESMVLRELAHQYGSQLRRFEGTLFQVNAPGLLDRMDIEWHNAFRLLQFAVWLGEANKLRKFATTKTAAAAGGRRIMSTMAR
ncbi:MAG: hypothetical protein A2178_02220 [Planctomycetes bacterium GWC2_49_10]|nr:MAG: hypothetical protein A2178_02220 [Planctomycetes bacterium GWC2_49_10]